MGRIVWGGVLALTVVLAAAGPASAQISYQFATDAGAVSGSFDVSVGGTVNVRVYLVDASTNAAVFNANGGLGAAAVRLQYNNPAAGSAVVASTAAITPNTSNTPTAGQFESPGGLTADTNSAALSLASSFSQGVTPDTNGRILLATFTITGVAAGTITLEAVDRNTMAGYDTASYDTSPSPLFAPLVNYDPLIGSATATLTISPVPEPALGLLATAVGLGGWSARRRLGLGAG